MGRRKQINLSEEQEDQVRSMRREGKTYEEVKGFFQDNYMIKLNDPFIAGLMKSSPRGHYKKRGQKLEAAAIDDTKDEDQAVKLICRAYAVHKKDFLKIVEEAIKEK